MFEDLTAKKTPELWLLINDVDETFTCVPSIDNVHELDMMTKCFEKAGINFDVEKTHVQLNDFSQVTDLVVPIEKTTEFTEVYLKSVLKEQELMSEIKALRENRNKTWLSTNKNATPGFFESKMPELLSDNKLEPGKECFINSRFTLMPSPVKSVPNMQILTDHKINDFCKNCRTRVDAQINPLCTACSLNANKNTHAFEPFSAAETRYAEFNPIQTVVKRDATHSLIVLYNEKRMVSVVFDNIDIKKMVDKYPEYGFKSILNVDCTYDVKMVIYNTFNAVLHPSDESLNCKIEFCNNYIQTMSKNMQNVCNEDTEEETVLTVIKERFIITDNIDQRMKAQDIFDFFSQHSQYLPFKIDTMFRNRLSKYLIKLGLTKKRYSDGYYYYGIVKRHDSLPTYNMFCGI